MLPPCLTLIYLIKEKREEGEKAWKGWLLGEEKLKLEFFYFLAALPLFDQILCVLAFCLYNKNAGV